MSESDYAEIKDILNKQATDVIDNIESRLMEGVRSVGSDLGLTPDNGQPIETVLLELVGSDVVRRAKARLALRGPIMKEIAATILKQAGTERKKPGPKPKGKPGPKPKQKAADNGADTE